MSGNNEPSSTPVVTPSPVTPAPIANLTAPPKGVPNPWANAVSSDPLPTGVMPRPNIGVRPVVHVDVQRAIETERVERAERPTPNGLPSARTASSDAPTSAPVVASVVPRMEDAQATGPITKRQRAFFASPPKVEVSGVRNAPPLVPLPKPSDVRPSERVEMSGGVVVIERTSTAWIATGAVAVAGIVIALILGLDASATSEKLRAKEAEATELTKRVAELEAVKPAPVAPPPAPVIASDAQPIADALRARLPVELTRGDARVVVAGAQVILTIDNVLDKKGKLSKKAPELLARVGAAVAPLAKGVDVVAYSDGNVGRGKSEWGQSAARATNAARALRMDAKHVAVVGKGKGPSRRIELVITAR